MNYPIGMAFLLFCSCSSLWAGEDRMVDKITAKHPRIIMTDERVGEIQALLRTDADLQKLVKHLEQLGDFICQQPVATYNLVGNKRKRLLRTSRLVLARANTLGVLYRLDGKTKWKQRLVEELKAVCAFPDWHHKHYLDTAEMSAAVALGYDWLYNDLSKDERAIIRDGLVRHGIDTGLRGGWWVQTHNNWNQVCHCGLTLAALTLADEVPEKAEKLLQSAKANHIRSLEVYAPNGVYPEGPGYWNYGTSFSIFMSSALMSTIGSDWGILARPGFADSFEYRMQVEGPIGAVVNYADGGDRAGPSPCHYYMAGRTGTPGFSTFAMRSLARDLSTISSKTHKTKDKSVNRFFPLAIAWYVPETKAAKQPLDWFATGDQGVNLALMRSAWGDRDALFASLKAGSLVENHGHLDTGSFILDVKGIRWSSDPGSEREIYDRKDSWGKGQDAFRWTFLRANNFGHSTLTINKKIHRVKGTAPIIRTGSGKSPFAVADLSQAFAGQATSVKRGIMMPGRKAVVIRDEIEGVPKGQPVVWNMMNRTDIKLGDKGRTATLSHKGKTLAVVLQSKDGRFRVTDAKPGREMENQNEGWQRLQIEVTSQGKPMVFQVAFFPDKPVDLDMVPLAQWQE
jgi:hypothetical protein